MSSDVAISPDCRLIDKGGEFRRQHLNIFVGVNFAHYVSVEMHGSDFGVSRNLRHLLGVLFREHINVCIGGVVTAGAATRFAFTHSYLPFGVWAPCRFCDFIYITEGGGCQPSVTCVLIDCCRRTTRENIYRRTWRGKSWKPADLRGTKSNRTPRRSIVKNLVALQHM